MNQTLKQKKEELSKLVMNCEKIKIQIEEKVLPTSLIIRNNIDHLGFILQKIVHQIYPYQHIQSN